MNRQFTPVSLLQLHRGRLACLRESVQHQVHVQTADTFQVRRGDSERLFLDQTQALPNIGIEASFAHDTLEHFVGFVLENIYGILKYIK